MIGGLCDLGILGSRKGKNKALCWLASLLPRGMEGSAVDLISRPGSRAPSLGSHLPSLKLNRELANRVGACLGLPPLASASSVTIGDNPPEAVSLIILHPRSPHPPYADRLLLPPTALETKGRSQARPDQGSLQNQGMPVGN